MHLKKSQMSPRMKRVLQLMSRQRDAGGRGGGGGVGPVKTGAHSGSQSGGGPSSRPDILFVRHSKANKFEFLKCVIKCP